MLMYKKNCDPCDIPAGAVAYHRQQGWVDDPDDLEDSFEEVAPVKPYIFGQDDPAPGIPAPAADTVLVTELREIIAARDQQIIDMQTDFEEVNGALNATIAGLKAQLPAIPGGALFTLPSEAAPQMLTSLPGVPAPLPGVPAPLPGVPAPPPAPPVAPKPAGRPKR